MAAVSLAIPKRLQPASVWLLYIVGLFPAAYEFYLGASGNLGADPVKTFELFLGLWAIRFLLLTLAVTPLRDLVGWNLLRYRRALGLICFYYVFMHFLVYVILDQALMFDAILGDILKRPFIMFGMAGLVMLTALAATSNRFSIRKMGKNWIWLHRLIYVITACGALHFALSTKILSVEQFVYIGLLIAMILYRAYRPILMLRRRGSRRVVPA